MDYNQRNSAGRNTQCISIRSCCDRWRPDLVAMKNIYEVLRNKEMDLERLRIEVDALRFVAPLLADQTAESSDVGAMRQPEVAWIPEMQRNKWPVKMGHPGPTYSDS